MTAVRPILRKLYGQKSLSDMEYSQLMEYAENLRANAWPSYQLFYERFAAILARDYNTYLPRYAYGSDDFFDYLLSHPAQLEKVQAQGATIDVFPSYLHAYLADAFPDGVVKPAGLPWTDLLAASDRASLALPRPRRRDLVCKYESGNAYKEIGLKSHFERIGRYSFVSRLQSIRYLRGHKAGEDSIEPVSNDCLAGVFTNKEKSIYYYVFLTEADDNKARNACLVLNRALYGN